MKPSRLVVLASVCLLAALAFAASAAAFKLPGSNDVHWKLIVCSSRTSSITLYAGPSQSDNAIFAIWKMGEGQKTYDLPDRLQHLETVYVKAVTPEHEQVEICVLYDGHGKKRFGFSHGDEDHLISASDKDDNDCRCLQ